VKILHIASFTGNIGDNASHQGFYNILSTMGLKPSVTQLEMRNFYQNAKPSRRRHFDRDLITEMNQYDRVVIGGGGFFDYWISGSQSGTTIDMDPGLINFIEVPLWFTSIGSAPHHSVPDENRAKFRKFLDACFSNSKVTINVRNDGSIKAITDDIGKSYAGSINEILDHGFFYVPKPSFQFPLDSYIAINITSDQLEMKRKSGIDITPDDFFNRLAKCLTEVLANTDKSLLFIPHSHQDLNAIHLLLQKMNDFDKRSRITVAPCVQNQNGADYLFNLYSNADLALGMRFHANVCCLAMQAPVIGLQALDRVGYVYNHLELTNNSVRVDGDFSKSLTQKILNALINPSEFVVGETLKTLKNETLNQYQNFG
jgi:polysaccharide pyruvyl transferase WcaK-like protein